MLRVLLFGRLALERNDRLLDELASNKVRELLGYLVLHRGQPQRREALGELLWSDSRVGEPDSKSKSGKTLYENVGEVLVGTAATCSGRAHRDD